MAYKLIKGKNKIRGEQTFVDNILTSGSSTQISASVFIANTISGSVISASYFVGNGSLLTNISSSSGQATAQGPEYSVQFKSGSEGSISGSSNLIFDYTIPKLTVNSGFVTNRVSTSTDLTLSAGQYIIGVDTLLATASIKVILPNASTLSNGQIFVIKDEGGAADINNIIISCSVGSQTIDGEETVAIESPYSAINIYSNGSNKYFIY